MRGPSRTSRFRVKQQAAREQLHGHIDEGLLEGFIRRNLTPEQHATVLAHLGKCHDCQEAVAFVLLSHQDPTAAAEIVLESEKRAKQGGVWWRVALRWTGVVFGIFAIGLLLYLLPTANRPDFPFTSIFNSSNSAPPAAQDSSSESDTAFSDWIASTFSSKKDEKPSEDKSRKRSDRKSRQISPGWDTGAAPYHDKVQPTPGAIEVEIPRSEPPKPEDNKSAAATTVAPAPAPGPSAPLRSAAGAPRVTTTRKLVVTDEGELMRTLDGGATWKVITIKRGLAFNSLAVSGGNIWAAGDYGALYRSPDAAEHWQQVIVKYRGVPLADHIDQIRFADAQHGQFITAEGDSWITVDGGNKWVLSYRHKSAQ
jgi:hypothetical protein